MKIIKESLHVEDLLNDIKQRVEQSLRKIAASPEFGFDEDEFNNYFRVDVELVDDYQVRIEVGAEVDYDGLEEIGETLNNEVEKYDRNAYFEPVEPGITECYIDLSNEMGNI